MIYNLKGSNNCGTADGASHSLGKTILRIISVLTFVMPTTAQAQLYVGAKSALYVPAGHVLHVDSLTLRPTTTLMLSNNRIEKSITPQWTPGPSHTSIRQVYIVDTPIMFQGTASITYSQPSLNGNTAGSLVMVKAPGRLDSFQIATSSSVNIATRTVSAVFSAPLRLGKFSAADGGIPLPLRVQSFDAWPADERVKLIWQVTNERDIVQYLVERSDDGNNFYPLMSMTASGREEYALWDEAPLVPTNYYRLSAIHQGGARSYFGVRKVTFNGSREDLQISIWPLPVDDDLQLSFSEFPLRNSMISICDMAGRIVHQTSVLSQRTSLSLAHLSAGIYLLHYTSLDVTRSIRIEKR